jgi:hypothetical protein
MSRLSIFLLFLVVTFGCRDSIRDKDNDLVTAMDYSTSMNAINDLVKQIHNVAINDSILSELDTNYSPSACFQSKNLVSAGLGFPYILTIDFGSNSTCIDERIRRGKISVRFSGLYNSIGTLMEVSTENYYVQEREVNFSGSLLVTDSDSSYLKFQRKISSGEVILPSSQGRLSALSRISGQDMVEIMLQSTPEETDDEFRIEGTLSGTSTTGVTYISGVSTPLSTSIPCRFETSGSFTVSASNIASRFGDYGVGDCDNIVTLSLHGVDYEKKLSD